MVWLALVISAGALLALAAPIVDRLRFERLHPLPRLNRLQLAQPPFKVEPLPAGVACYAIAATTAAGSGGVADRLIGDGLVPVASALGLHKDPARALAFPADHQWVACQTGHLDLLSRPEVCERIVEWLEKKPSSTAAG